MYAQIAIVVLIIPVATVKMTQWYAKRCAENSKKIVNEKLLHFQSIANTYTDNGTPKELQKMIEDLEEVMEELKFLDQN